MNEIEGIEDFNNMGALYGIDGLEGDAELMGMLGRIKNPIKRKRFINKMASTGMASKGSRAEMEKHFGELPRHIQEGLKKGDLRLADMLIYSIKPINNSKTIKLFETQDDKEIGLRNISNAKLPKNSALLVSGITILAGVSADATKDKVMSTSFDKIEDFPAICTGEFNLKSNKKVIVPEMSTVSFKTNNMN